MLTEAGFTITAHDQRVARTGVVVDLVAADAIDEPWHFLVAGSHVSHRGGLARTDVVWRTLGQAHALRGRGPAGVPVVVLTTELPRRPSDGDAALRAAGPAACFDVVDLLADDARARLQRYAKGDQRRPEPGFWTVGDLDPR